MATDISCHMWSSVYKCQRVEYAFIYPVRTECGMFVMCCMKCCCSVVSLCQLFSSAWMCCLEEACRCNCDVFSVVNV